MLTNIWIAKQHFENCELKCCNLYLTTISWLTRLRHNQKPEINVDNYFSLSELSLNIVFVLRLFIKSDSCRRLIKSRSEFGELKFDKEFNFNVLKEYCSPNCNTISWEILKYLFQERTASSSSDMSLEFDTFKLHLLCSLLLIYQCAKQFSFKNLSFNSAAFAMLVVWN